MPERTTTLEDLIKDDQIAIFHHAVWGAFYYELIHGSQSYLLMIQPGDAQTFTPKRIHYAWEFQDYIKYAIENNKLIKID